jgi:hypothetical protein
LAAATAPNYRLAPGRDRCDCCFFRMEDGTGCTRFDLGDAYRPNFLCDDYAQRSMAQRYEDEATSATNVDKKADATLAAEDNADALDAFAAINNVEIFRTGTWNGKKYTTATIDKIVAAAATQGYRPPVTLGHSAEPDAPAYGYVTNLRRQGDVLVGDFEDVPQELVDQIRDKRFDAVSCEIYFDLERDKLKFPFALRSVAVLGAHPPAVASLKPLSDSLAGLAEGTKFVSVDYAPDSGPVTVLFDDPEESPYPEQPASPTPKHPYPPYQRKRSSTENDPMPVKNTAGGDPADNANTVTVDAAELAALQSRISEMQAQLESSRAAAAQASTSQLTIQRLQEQVATLNAQQRADNERRRQEQIDRLVKDTVRPSFRNHIRALAELGTRGDGAEPGAKPQTVKFQAFGADEPAETEALGVIADFVRLLNSDVAHLFQEQIANGEIPRQLAGGVDDPSAQLNALVGDYIRAHPGTEVDVARRAVWQDPKHRDIVKRWNNINTSAN